MARFGLSMRRGRKSSRGTCYQSLKQTAIRACGGVAISQRREFALAWRVTTGNSEATPTGLKLSAFAPNNHPPNMTNAIAGSEPLLSLVF
jgi:hypothetical protein